jgi:hypothetical protein
MSAFKSVINWGPASRVRRNHALEHATIQVLTTTHPGMRLAGLSDVLGFWILGDVDIEALADATEEARKRLNDGESALAIHPNCGTNLATAGMIGGFFAWLSMLGVGKSWRERLDRLPVVLTLVTMGLVIAQPLGPKLQKHVTTEANLGDLHVTGIHCYPEMRPPAYRVMTSG